jgi:hypothetical protein
MQKLVTLLKQLIENNKVIKSIAAVGILALSFSLTSYYIARRVAAVEEQRQDDYINDTVGSVVVEIRDPEGVMLFHKNPLRANK